MEICISVEDHDPPTGTVRVDRAPRARGPEATSEPDGAFSGWLGLLAVLDDLLGASEGPGPP